MLVVAACSSTPPPGSAPAPSVTVHYVETASPPVVEVAAASALALSTVELVAPDGKVLATAAAEREATPGGGGFALPPTVGVGVFGGSGGGFGTGIGLGFPLGGAAPPPAQPVRARARVPITDVEGYTRDWPNLLVRLRFGAPPGDTSTADIPAPAPR